MLEPGQSLGPYQIVSLIAAGVYRARDPRMARDVGERRRNPFAKLDPKDRGRRPAKTVPFHFR
jgi:hypothetical protein